MPVSQKACGTAALTGVLANQPAERGELLKLKAEEHEKYGYPPSDEFFIW